MSSSNDMDFISIVMRAHYIIDYICDALSTLCGTKKEKNCTISSKKNKKNGKMHLK